MPMGCWLLGMGDRNRKSLGYALKEPTRLSQPSSNQQDKHERHRGTMVLQAVSLYPHCMPVEGALHCLSANGCSKSVESACAQ